MLVYLFIFNRYFRLFQIQKITRFFKIWKNKELRERLIKAKLPVVDILELKEKTEAITGKPQKASKGDKVVAEVIGRDGNILDRIYNVL